MLKPTNCGIIFIREFIFEEANSQARLANTTRSYHNLSDRQKEQMEEPPLVENERRSNCFDQPMVSTFFKSLLTTRVRKPVHDGIFHLFPQQGQLYAS